MGYPFLDHHPEEWTESFALPVPAIFVVPKQPHVLKSFSAEHCGGGVGVESTITPIWAGRALGGRHAVGALAPRAGHPAVGPAAAQPLR